MLDASPSLTEERKGPKADAPKKPSKVSCAARADP